MSLRMPLLPAMLALMLSVTACTTIPDGPSLNALPGTGKNFGQFRHDDADCRQWAHTQAGGTTANEAAINSGLASAAVGTAIGTVAGAAMGGSSGAAAGAGVGLAMGALAGTGTGQASGRNLQQRYDNAYGQCMYAKGHKIPVSAAHAASLAPLRAPARPHAPPPPPPPYR